MCQATTRVRSVKKSKVLLYRLIYLHGISMALGCKVFRDTILSSMEFRRSNSTHSAISQSALGSLGNQQKKGSHIV
jgi:hypothetical protein